MSLFPAYGEESPACAVAEPVARWEAAPESELLASSDSDTEPGAAARGAVPAEADYYEDRRFDGGNLRVSTIYFPGRPQYNREDMSRALGALGAPRGARKRTRRYWQQAPGAGEGAGAPGDGEGAGAPGAGEGAGAPAEGERAAALRRALAERPGDEALWLQYVDYQEWISGSEAALQAAEEGAERLPRAPRLAARRLLALQRAAAPRRALARLRDMLATEKDLELRAALWTQLVALLARAGEGASGAGRAAAAAAGDLRRLPAAYPRLLLAHGLVLRAGGLWETLVLLLELVLCMSSPAAAARLPPPRDVDKECAAEERLLDLEDKVIHSGLPSGAVWARVERARAAAHWRPARAHAAADPQRAPEPADVADLLLPVSDPDALLLLYIHALRLAKVPLLPSAGYVAAAAGAGDDADATGEALLAPLRAARRLAPAHPARPAPRVARRLLRAFSDPPHYFSDDCGFRGWTDALWDAALAAAAGEARAALLCWRLRWLHSLLLLVHDDPERAAEAKRIRDGAQAALRQFGGSHPVPFALFARLAGGAGGRRAALVALRAALPDASLPHRQLLYVARIVQEVCGGGPELCAEGAWALASAALRRALPEHVARAPPPALLRDALSECERRCADLEASMEQCGRDAASGAPGSGAALAAAMLPGEAEWAVARALLAPPARRHELLQRLLAEDVQDATSAGERWREQQAASLLLRPGAGAGAARRALSARHPHSCLLALLSGGAAPWAPGVTGAGRADAAGAADSGARRLGAVWPALLRAVASDWEPEASGVLARILRRQEGGGGGGGGALAWALRLQAEAHAPAPRLQRAALAALDAQPAHKWLAVRCAALGGCSGGATLPELLLERGLRLHALPDELRVLASPPRAPTASPPRDPS